jgi:hypothetical protein
LIDAVQAGDNAKIKTLLESKDVDLNMKDQVKID